MSDRITIWGAGAIGGTLGAHLVRAGHDVLFVDTVAEHVAAMRARGLEITGPVSPLRVGPVPASLPGDVRGRLGTVLLCVKAHHTRAATEAIAPRLAPDGAVVSVQNGLNEEVVADVVGPERTIGCFVNFGADYMEPGEVHYGGRGAVVVGELDGRRSPRIERLHALFRELDADAVLTDNIFGYLWAKLAYASMLFATATTDDSIADALARPSHRDVYADLAREVMRVAAAEGVRPEPFDGFDPAAFAPGAAPEQATASLDGLVAHNRKSAKTHSGIWRDLAVRRRRTEVDAQLGPVVAHGRDHGVPTPMNAALVAMIHALEGGRRERAPENVDALRATVEEGS